jgi:hypothetical protein
MATLTDRRAIKRFFADRALTGEESWYLDFNSPRYVFLLREVHRVAGALGKPDGDGLRVLDIGPGFQTELVRGALPRATVDTLGFVNPLTSPRDGERHIQWDLNDAYWPERWPDTGPHDLVLMAEVIEHLYTSAGQVLAAIVSFMAQPAYLLLQTPNAVALHKRVQMLAGRHPFGPISDNRSNPMHFREYTTPELIAAAREVGLEPDGLFRANYFRRDSLTSRGYNAVSHLLPGSLRAGISLTLRRG